jgi:hypothetical protein
MMTELSSSRCTSFAVIPADATYESRGSRNRQRTINRSELVNARLVIQKPAIMTDALTSPTERH